MTDSAVPAVSTKTYPLTWGFALIVVAGSFAAAVLVRWLIVFAASDWARHQISGHQVLLITAAFALVIGYMVTVGGVGLGMRNRTDGGRFTLFFALMLAGVHVVSGLAWGIGILALPFGDASSLVILPLLYTVPAAAVRLIRWYAVPAVAAIGAVAWVVIALFTGRFS